MSITTWGWGTHGTISDWGWGGWFLPPPELPPTPPLPPFECSRISLIEKATNKLIVFANKDGVPRDCKIEPIERYQRTIFELCRRISALETHLMALVDDKTELQKEIERLGLVIDPISVLDCLMMGTGRDPTEGNN